MTLDEIKAINISANTVKDVESRRLQNAYFVAKLIDKDTPQMINSGELHRLSYLFNTECKGWHYAWVGNRFTSKNTDHVFSISIFLPSIEKQDDPSNILYKPLAFFSSPHFTIASLRRKKEAEERRTNLILADSNRKELDPDASDADEDVPIMVQERDDPNIDQINQIKAKNTGEPGEAAVIQEKVAVPIPTGKSVESKTVETDLCEYGYVAKTINLPQQNKPRQPTTFYNGSMLRSGDIDRSIAAVCTPLSTLISSMKFPAAEETHNNIRMKTKHYDVEAGNPVNNDAKFPEPFGNEPNEEQMRHVVWRSLVPSNISLSFANKMKVSFISIYPIIHILLSPLKDVFSLFEDDFEEKNPGHVAEEYRLSERDVLGNEVFRNFCESMGSLDSSFSKHWPQVLLISSLSSSLLLMSLSQ